MNSPVIQDWVQGLSFMQQTVLLTVVRGPDTTEKYSAVKYLLRWYRRCILISAFDKCVLNTPVDNRGGSFTGPSFSHSLSKYPELIFGVSEWEEEMDEKVIAPFLKQVDMLPLHFFFHLLHAIEIVGYKHPNKDIRLWWFALYTRVVTTLHLNVESEEALNFRLGDSELNWRTMSDDATVE